MEASPSVRVKRVAERDDIDIEKALNVLEEKDKRTEMIYKDLYGFDLGKDFSPFHLILVTDLLDIDEVFYSVSLVVDRLVFGKS